VCSLDRDIVAGGERRRISIGCDRKAGEIRRLALGQVDKQNSLAARRQFGKRASHLGLGIVGMSGDDEAS
jgi:hypothetical protein